MGWINSRLYIIASGRAVQQNCVTSGANLRTMPWSHTKFPSPFQMPEDAMSGITWTQTRATHRHTKARGQLIVWDRREFSHCSCHLSIRVQSATTLTKCYDDYRESLHIPWPKGRVVVNGRKQSLPTNGWIYPPRKGTRPLHDHLWRGVVSVISHLCFPNHILQLLNYGSSQVIEVKASI